MLRIRTTLRPMRMSTAESAQFAPISSDDVHPRMGSIVNEVRGVERLIWRWLCVAKCVEDASGCVKN